MKKTKDRFISGHLFRYFYSVSSKRILELVFISDDDTARAIQMGKIKKIIVYSPDAKGEVLYKGKPLFGKLICRKEGCCSRVNVEDRKGNSTKVRGKKCVNQSCSITYVPTNYLVGPKDRILLTPDEFLAFFEDSCLAKVELK